jgi:hypothetical protein
MSLGVQMWNEFSWLSVFLNYGFLCKNIGFLI